MALFASPALAAAPASVEAVPTDPAAADATVTAVTYGVIAILAVAAVIGGWRFGLLKPGGLDNKPTDRAPVRSGGRLPGIAWAGVAIGLYAVMTFGSVVGVAAAMPIVGIGPDELTSAVDSPKFLGVVSLVTYLIGVPVAAVAAAVVAPIAPAAGLKLRFRDLWVGLLAFLWAIPVVQGASIASALIFSALGSTPDTVAHEALDAIMAAPGDPWTWATIASVTIGAPVFEEIMFRGFLQTAVRTWTGSGWTAVVLTSLVFAASHAAVVGVDGLYALAGLCALSLAMGAAFERTRSLGVPILMHVLFNTANVGLALLLSALDSAPDV